MRLIDADKITNVTIDDIQIYRFNSLPYIKVEDLLKFIDTLPTAYDVDKVVEELEEITNNYIKYDPPLEDYEEGFEAGVEVMADKAIKIVKAGCEK